MRLTLTKIPAVLCTLILALPPGWCCMLASSVSCGGAEQTRKCCPSGDREHQSPICPSQGQQQTPEKCSCFNPQIVLDKAKNSLPDDSSFVALLPEFDLTVSEPSHSVQNLVESNEPISILPLNILHCCWLC